MIKCILYAPTTIYNYLCMHLYKKKVRQVVVKSFCELIDDNRLASPQLNSSKLKLQINFFERREQQLQICVHKDMVRDEKPEKDERKYVEHKPERETDTSDDRRDGERIGTATYARLLRMST